MSPIPGSIHRRPRSDSGAVRLWAWARARRRPWTCPEAAEQCRISSGRCRAIVRAMHDTGLLDQVRGSELVGGLGQGAAEWRLSAEGRAARQPPVLVVDGERGIIVGTRPAGDGRGNALLRQAVDASGLTRPAAAARLGVHVVTLQRWLAGSPPIAADDPMIERARWLARR